MEKIKINIGGVITELDKEVVSGALETGELKIENENLVIYDKPSFETYKKNISDQEYKKGRIEGVEIFSKQVKKDGGFEFENPKVIINDSGNVDFEKTSSEFLGKIKPALESKLSIEPSKKIQELEADKSKLLSNYQTLESEFTGFKTSIAQKETQVKKDSTLLSFIPEKGLKVGRDIALLAVKSKFGLDITFDDSGQIITTKNGVQIKDDKTLQPVPLKDLMPSLIKELDLFIPESGGNGGNDEPGGGSSNQTTYDKFVDDMKKNGIDEGSMQFAEEMQKRQKAGTLKI